MVEVKKTGKGRNHVVEHHSLTSVKWIELMRKKGVRRGTAW